MTDSEAGRHPYRVALFAIAMVVLVVVLFQLRWVLLQLFAAFIVAAGMAPIVARFTDPNRQSPVRWRPPKAVVVLVIYLLVGSLALLVGSIIFGSVLQGANTLMIALPQYAATIQSWLIDLQARLPALQQYQFADLFGGVSGLTQWIVDLLGQMLNAASVLFSFFGGALNVLFVLFMALYITVGASSMLEYVIPFVPASRQAQTRRVATNIGTRLSHWVVGQLLLAFIIGTVAGVGLGLLGVPGAPVLGVIWAIAEFIPGIGPFIAAVPSITLGFLAGPTTGVLASVFTLAWSQIESNVLTPRLMGRAVELNPLVVLMSLLVGNELLGLAGALFAIPAAAVIGVVVDELRQERLAKLLIEDPTLPLAATAAEVPPL